ncbi:MAG: hypothetical protein F6K25_18340 [Okeania sp. SIO2G4]|uniref:nSTAND1 domain-containing NTPase n=1 Tax=unclassified Okeania TaxID=2634635 RepID=UPI0013BCFCF4|nr:MULTISPECIES: caspase family protein [unclassified Okeania]NEP39382.1 hypothetical protein [Okeania sp. SIO2H7]NEP94357.1 hypothetical protein [Okeania sp. SIO2F5]NEQ92538.1 hypothetical protein [Okeania sp. SIO2G4]
MFKIKLLGFVPQPNLQFIKKLIMSRDALVIGINTYSYERLNNLTAPGQDAEAVAKLLENYGDFKVTRLPAVKDKQNNTVRVGQKTKVTLNHLENTIIQLFTPDGKPPDTALLYFSGHGLRKSKGRIQEGFLASSDVNPDVGNWGLSLQWLRRLLQESEVRQQIIILDCCHAGEILNVADANPGNIGKARDRCFIAASRAFEVAFEEIDGNHSVLTAALIKGLEPQQNRWVTNYTLVDLLNQEQNAFPQRPTFSNSGEPINLTRRFTAVTNIPTPSGQGICPYKGLAYFDCTEEDARYFYGRTALTDELLEKVRVGNFLAVLGASGSGKSSVVRAGLLYQLQLGRRLSGSESWQIKIFHPGEHPLNSLALAFLDSELSDIERATQLAQAQELIKKGSEGLRQIISVADTPKLVLVVDQFEEAFTLCQDTSERQQFFACLFDALPKTDKLCLVLTMRADFFSKCIEQEYSGLAQLMQQHGVVVMGMSEEELRKAIVEPAKQVDLEIESALVEQILADVADAPGYLPLLQYTLTRLWEERTDNCLRLNTYVQLGGVMGTLRQRADQVYKGFSEEEKAAARYIFLELTQLGEGTEDTRRRVLQTNLVNQRYGEKLIETVVQKLADEKLVVTTEIVAKGGGAERVAVVDVAHEALIRHWSLLRSWVSENRDVIRIKRKIEMAAEEWKSQGKLRDYLLVGLKLTEAENFLGNYFDLGLLSVLGKEFIERSIQQRKINKWFRVGEFAAFISVVVLGAGLSIYLGMQLSVQLQKQPLFQIQNQTLFQNFGSPSAIAFSPDGQLILTGSRDTIRLWNREGKLLHTVAGHTGDVTAIAFSPDGKLILSASRDRTLRLWDTDSGQLLHTMKGHKDDVTAIAFSPDGQQILSASRDRTLRLWDTDSGQLLRITSE